MFVYIVVTLIALAVSLYVACWLMTFVLFRLQRTHEKAMDRWEVECRWEDLQIGENIVRLWKRLIKWRKKVMNAMSVILLLASALLLPAYDEYQGQEVRFSPRSVLAFSCGIFFVFVLRKTMPRVCLRRWSDGGEFQEKEMDNN